ALYNTAAAL
nr:Chain C, GAG PEPTIDE [synthetic construct]